MGFSRSTALLLASLLASACGGAERPRRDARPDLILVSIDTLRADALSTYGSSRPTRAFAALAAESVTFDQAVAPSSWTIPSHISLFTGLDPRVPRADGQIPLPAGFPVLAEHLRDVGYRTVGIVNSSYVGEKFGFKRGFDEFVLHPGEKDGPASIDLALEHLAARGDEPIFLFLHLFDIHGPFRSPEPYADLYLDQVSPATPEAVADIDYLRGLAIHDYLPSVQDGESVEGVRARYDAGVARMDAEIRRFIEGLEALGLMDDAWLFVTSDHGEGFFERRVSITHGIFLYEAEIWIPLFVHAPRGLGVRPRRVDTPVSLVDLAPTLLEIAGARPDVPIQGESLLPLIRGEQPENPERIVFGSSRYLEYAAYARTGRWKYIEAWPDVLDVVVDKYMRPKDGEVRAQLVSRLDPRAQLYDLDNDPGETENVIARHPQVAERLQRALERHRSRGDQIRAELMTDPGSEVDLSEDEKRRLRELGYVH